MNKNKTAIAPTYIKNTNNEINSIPKIIKSIEDNANETISASNDWIGLLT